jgi:hypothetical protein
MASDENSEPEGRKIVVEVGDTTHDEEGSKVEEPAHEGDLADIQPLLPLSRSPLLVVALHAEDVPSENAEAERNGKRREPPDDRCAEEVELDLVVTPAAHTETKVEEGPVKRLRSKNVLLVGVRNESVVRCPHGNVEVREVPPEGRLVKLDVSRLKLLVPVRLDVPVRVHILGVVLLGARDFDLLEAPLRKDRVGRAEVAAEVLVTEAQASGESVDASVILHLRLGALSVIDNLNNPVVLSVANGVISVTRDLPRLLGNRGSDGVRVELTTG